MCILPSVILQSAFSPPILALIGRCVSHTISFSIYLKPLKASIPRVPNELDSNNTTTILRPTFIDTTERQIPTD